MTGTGSRSAPTAYDVIMSGGAGDVTAPSEALLLVEDATSAGSESPSSLGDPLLPGCLLYKFVVASIIALVCLAGFVGNTIAFLVFQRDTMKTSTSFIFQGLAVIDNVLMLTALPLYFPPSFVAYTGLGASYIAGPHQIVLVYVLPVAFLTQTATIWVTVLVGVNRYIAVCRPYQAARLCTVRQAKIQLTIVLTCVVLYNIPRFAAATLGYDETHEPVSANTTAAADSAAHHNYRLVAKYTSLGEHRLYQIIYDNILYTVFMLALPLLSLTVLNVRLIRALRALRRKRAEMHGSRSAAPTGFAAAAGASSSTAADGNVTLVLIVVVLVFTVCQTPALATQLMWSLLDDAARECGGFQFYFSVVSNLLVIANSAANFPIYLLFNTRFRTILGQLLGVRSADSGSRSGATTVTRLSSKPGRGGRSAGCVVLQQSAAPTGSGNGNGSAAASKSRSKAETDDEFVGENANCHQLQPLLSAATLNGGDSSLTDTATNSV